MKKAHCFLLLCFPLMIKGVLIPVPAISDQKIFYQTLNNIHSDSNVNPISIFCHLLNEQPNNEILIERLITFSIKEGNIDSVFSDSALSFLNILPAMKAWIRAKAAQFHENPQKALEAYQQAISQDTIGIHMLRDFCLFCVQNNISYDAEPVISHLQVDTLLFKAFYFHESQQWEMSQHWISKALKKNRNRGLLYYIAAVNYYRLYQFHKADSLLIIADNVSEVQYDFSLKSRILTLWGMLARSNRDFNHALQYYSSADSLARRMLDFHQMNVNAANRGNVYFQKGEFDKAINQYKNAISIAKSIRAYHQLAYWYQNYGLALGQVCQYYEAVQAFQEAKKYACQTGLKTLAIEMMMREADVFAYLNQDPLALNIYQVALEKSKAQSNTALTQQLMTRCANQMVAQKQYGEAQAIYHKYIHNLHKQNRMKEQAYWTAQLAACFESEGDFQHALQYYRQAMQISQKASDFKFTMWFLNAMAHIHEQLDDFSEAVKKYRLVIQCQDSIPKDLVAEAWLGLGNVYLRQNLLSESINALKHAVVLIEEGRNDLDPDPLRIGYLGKHVSIYKNLAMAYGLCFQKTQNPAYVDSLLFYYQLSRARSLREMLTNRSDLISTNNSNESLQTYHTVCNQFQQCQRRLRDSFYTSKDSMDILQAHFEAAKLSLLSQRMKLFTASNSNRSKDSEKFNSELCPDGFSRDDFGMALYHLTDTHAFALVSSTNDAVLIPLNVRLDQVKMEIDSLIRPLHHFQSDEPIFYARIAYRLYQLLIEPIEKVVELPEHLCVVPDLSLMNLPFEMLLSQKPGKSMYDLYDEPKYADHFLLNRYIFYYDHLASLTQIPLKSKNSKNGVVVLANPSFRSFNSESSLALRSNRKWCFEPLPFSEVEAEKIRAIFPHTKVFSRNQATERQMIKSGLNRQVLHLATHTVMDSVFPEFSGLVFSTTADSTDDGIFSGYEISDLSLSCDLVTLSACETGCGRLMPGEGVLGLPRSFLQAGARSVLMSLWKVDDRFASEFFPAFYRHIVQSGLSKAEALCDAKREIVTAINPDTRGPYFQHPFFWASFMLYGDQYTVYRQSTRIDYLWALVIICIGGLFFIVVYRNVRRKNINNPLDFL